MCDKNSFVERNMKHSRESHMSRFRIFFRFHLEARVLYGYCFDVPWNGLHNTQKMINLTHYQIANDNKESICRKTISQKRLSPKKISWKISETSAAKWSGGCITYLRVVIWVGSWGRCARERSDPGKGPTWILRHFIFGSGEARMLRTPFLHLCGAFIQPCVSPRVRPKTKLIRFYDLVNEES
jgi:hypothetical protein